MWEIKQISKTDDLYPKALKDLKNSPDYLFYVGDISLCNENVIAVIGSRTASERYLSYAKVFGELLAKKGITVLNGLAIGTDSLALKGALESGGKVVAVMPGGLDEIYPKSNLELAEKIVINGGCLISEYPAGAKPTKYSFVKRDRIQAMLAKKLFIVDAEEDGGTMRTAEYAEKYSKPLACFVEEKMENTPSGNRLLVEGFRAVGIKDSDALIDFVIQPEYKQMTFF